MGEDEGPSLDDDSEFGTPEALLTTAVDVSGFIEAKRASMACHRSQITDSSFFLQMPPEQFAAAFGTEWYIDLHGHRDPDEPFATDLFSGLT